MLYIQRKSSLILPLNGQGGDPVGEWKGEAFKKCLVGAGTRARVAQCCWRGFAQILRVT